MHSSLEIVGLIAIVYCLWISKFALSERCSDLSYGIHCNISCNEHCFLSSLCVNNRSNNNNVGCVSGGCNKGYANPPLCLLPCGKGDYIGKYGVNCSFVCHCKENIQEHCDSVSGNCVKGCHTDWFGAGCKHRKPQLMYPPQVVQNDCSGMIVRFNRFNSSYDIGEDQVDIYTLELLIDSGSWNQFENFSTTLPGNTFEKTFSFGFFNSSSSVRFRVSLYYKYSSWDFLSVPGNMSTAVTSECIRNPTNFVVKPSGSDLQFSWSLTSGLTNISISVTRVGIGDCWSPSSTEDPLLSISIPQTLLSYNFSGTNWTVYNVTWYGTDSSGKSGPVSSGLYTTESTKPLSSPNITVKDVAIDSINYTFSLPDCDKRGGAITLYDVEILERTSRKRVFQQDFKSLPSAYLHQTGLTAFTEYDIVVSFLNSVGRSPSALVTIRTLAGPPGPPLNLLTVKITSSTATLQWSAPSPTLAAIKEYFVMVTSPNQVTYNAGSSRSFTFTNLKSVTTYIVKVVAVSVDGVNGTQSDAHTFKTLSLSRQVDSLSVTARTSSSVSLSWKSPQDATNLVDYNITVTRTDTKLSGTQPEYSISVFETAAAISRTVSSLPASSFLEFSVLPRYNDSKAGVAAYVTAWTAPGDFPADSISPPLLKSSTTTTITITLSTISKLYTGGVISAYYIVVKLTSTSGRRRRAITVDQVNLSGGTIVAAFNVSTSTLPTTFIVGDAGVYSGYNNPALKPGSTYDVSLVVTSELAGSLSFYKATLNGATTQSSSSSTETTTSTTVQQSSNTTGLIIGIIILLLVIITIVVLVLLYLYRRHMLATKSDFHDYKLPVLELQRNDSNKGTNEPRSRGCWSSILDVSDPRKLMIDPSTNVDHLHVDHIGGLAFSEEFYKLPYGYQPGKTYNKARMLQNLTKHNCKDSLPYDHSLVQFIHDDNAYMNASFVDGYIRRKGYIAAQSPMSKSEADLFWKMLYQQNVAQIVMLCQVYDNETLGSVKYWPDVGVKANYGDILVEGICEENRNHYLQRVFSVQGARVTQYQLLSWPDKGVPDNPLPLLSLYTMVKVQSSIEDGPLMVHCESGCGRTAVFIALDYLLQQAMHEQCVNVFRCVQKLRKCRPNMITSVDQYVFLYDALFEALLVEGRNIVTADVDATLQLLSTKNSSIGKTYMWEQFSYLEKYTTKLDRLVGGQSQNLASNRDVTVLPTDRYRVRLAGFQRSYDYINAVWLDGFSLPDDMIITQKPLPNTMEDFWHMVWESRSSHVVDLQPEMGHSTGQQSFYPIAPHREVTAGCYTVTRIEHLDSGVDILRLSNSQLPSQSITVTLHTTDIVYSGNGSKRNVQDLRAMYDAVESLLLSTSPRVGPYILVCLNGSLRCGLFAACLICAQQLFHDGFTDVFHVVKWMKLRQPCLINTLDQYSYLFEFLLYYSRKKQLSSSKQRRRISKHCGNEAPLSDSLVSKEDPELETVYSHTQRPVQYMHRNDWVPYCYTDVAGLKGTLQGNSSGLT